MDDRMSVSFDPVTKDDLELLAWIEEMSEASVVRKAVRDYLLRRREKIAQARALKGQAAQSA
jgi:hypothetical protein